jgi:hypothetical protein
MLARLHVLTVRISTSALLIALKEIFILLPENYDTVEMSARAHVERARDSAS